MHFRTCVRRLLQLPYFSRMYVLPWSNIGLWQRRLWIDITFSRYFCSISTPEFDIDFFIDFGSLWHRFWVRFSTIFRQSVHFWVCYFSINFWNGFWKVLDRFCDAFGTCSAPPGWTRELTFGCLGRSRASWGGLLVVLGAVLDRFGGFGDVMGRF